MKAFLLAAGIGSRLRPLTDTVPKCLIPIDGKPLMHYWFQLFEQHGIRDVLINLHYLPEPVRQFVDRQPFNIRVTFFHEKELLGSAGTLRACRQYVEKEQAFLICYADNLTNVDLTAMVHQHLNSDPAMTIGLFEAENPSACGIVELDDKQNVVSFEEKPARPRGNLAGAGIYVASPHILDEIPDKKPADIGFDLLPKLVGNMKGYRIHEYFIDIGTFENYEKAQREWKHVNRE